MEIRLTGLFDRTGREIKEGDRIGEISDYDKDENEIMRFYTVCYGIGTFDSGAYLYIGFYLKDEETGETDGLASIMFNKDYIEIIL